MAVVEPKSQKCCVLIADHRNRPRFDLTVCLNSFRIIRVLGWAVVVQLFLCCALLLSYFRPVLPLPSSQDLVGYRAGVMKVVSLYRVSLGRLGSCLAVYLLTVALSRCLMDAKLLFTMVAPVSCISIFLIVVYLI